MRISKAVGSNMWRKEKCEELGEEEDSSID